LREHATRYGTVLQESEVEALEPVPGGLRARIGARHIDARKVILAMHCGNAALEISAKRIRSIW
jgi:hypothetical protein